MLLIYTLYPNLLAIDTSDESLISDYKIVAPKFIKLNLNKNWRFMVNILVNTKFSLNFFSYSRRIASLRNDTFEVNSLSASFLSSSVSLTRYYNITLGKKMTKILVLVIYFGKYLLF